MPPSLNLIPGGIFSKFCNQNTFTRKEVRKLDVLIGADRFQLKLNDLPKSCDMSYFSCSYRAKKMRHKFLEAKVRYHIIIICTTLQYLAHNN
jgi:hypothetical protein